MRENILTTIFVCIIYSCIVYKAWNDVYYPQFDKNWNYIPSKYEECVNINYYDGHCSDNVEYYLTEKSGEWIPNFGRPWNLSPMQFHWIYQNLRGKISDNMLYYPNPISRLVPFNNLYFVTHLEDDWKRKYIPFIKISVKLGIQESLFRGPNMFLFFEYYRHYYRYFEDNYQIHTNKNDHPKWGPFILDIDQHSIRKHTDYIEFPTWGYFILDLKDPLINICVDDTQF